MKKIQNEDREREKNMIEMATISIQQYAHSTCCRLVLCTSKPNEKMKRTKN